MSMFGPIVRSQQRLLQIEREENADRARRVAEEEARLDEPLTRREVVEAIESVVNEYAEHELLSEAFARLAVALS